MELLVLTHFERLAIVCAIGLSSGNAAEIRAGMRLIDKLDFPDAYKAGKQVDENGLLLGIPPADQDLSDTFEVSAAEKAFVKQRLESISGLPMNRRSVALLEKFGL